ASERRQRPPGAGCRGRGARPPARRGVGSTRRGGRGGGGAAGASAAAIGRVAERADEQRYVILLGIANLEHDLDERMERRDSQGGEVRPRVEAQAVRTGGRLQVAREQIRDAPVGVAPGRGQLGPTVARAARQRDRDAGRGPPPRDVQDVGRDAAHETTSLWSRSRVILACSSAAMRSSVVGSFVRRPRSAPSISSALLPVAEIRNTCPNRCWYVRFPCASAVSVATAAP